MSPKPRFADNPKLGRAVPRGVVLFFAAVAIGGMVAGVGGALAAERTAQGCGNLSPGVSRGVGSNPGPGVGRAVGPNLSPGVSRAVGPNLSPGLSRGRGPADCRPPVSPRLSPPGPPDGRPPVTPPGPPDGRPPVTPPGRGEVTPRGPQRQTPPDLTVDDITDGATEIEPVAPAGPRRGSAPGRR